ncbi:hypothetical protein WICPIJ_009481 [Wickerhamomyces pijperi]|uniref:t-SNARE coiled-coil homology domain-containing protein n=1 Tax=Wickerhamomyces pijperi TaxID=599730 RepID=A0A9P8TDI0_WICPI|nr:hypothetical protein WICPIJ_009481 [Wickerhamomyces pijperi]
MSRYAQVEQDNNAQFEQLSQKLSVFRQVSQQVQDISNEDHGLIDSLNDHMSNLFDSIKKTGANLTNVMNNNRFGTWRFVGIALLAFFILYTLWRLI